jgi:hypothetical protein
VRRRAEIYYQQLDALRSLRQQVRRDTLAESGKHGVTKLLRQIPSIGAIRAALLRLPVSWNSNGAGTRVKVIHNGWAKQLAAEVAARKSGRNQKLDCTGWGWMPRDYPRSSGGGRRNVS